MVIWIAIGVAISGYYYINPKMYSKRVQTQMVGKYQTIKVKGKEFETSVLITLVGTILIGGLGYTLRKK